MKKQIKLVVAVFVIMLVSVTSVFAKNPGDPVMASEFKAVPGTYEDSKDHKFEFWEGTDGTIWWEFDKYGTDVKQLHWANNDRNDDLMRIISSGNYKYYFRFTNNYNDRIKLVDFGEMKLTGPESALFLSLVLDDARTINNNSLFWMINKGVNVDYKACGTYALHEAAKEGNFPLAKKLVEKGATTNKKDKDGKTPADVAAAKGYDKLANYLRNPKSFKSPDPTDLVEAAEAGALDAVKKQVSLGADIDAHAKNSSGSNWTALALAAAMGHKDVVKYLIAIGCDIERQPPDSKGASGVGTALYYAARNGKLDCVKLLVDYGADVNAKNKSTGVRPLQIAQEKGRTEVVNYLKSKGAY